MLTISLALTSTISQRHCRGKQSWLPCQKTQKNRCLPLETNIRSRRTLSRFFADVLYQDSIPVLDFSKKFNVSVRGRATVMSSESHPSEAWLPPWPRRHPPSSAQAKTCRGMPATTSDCSVRLEQRSNGSTRCTSKGNSSSLSLRLPCNCTV